MTTMFVQTEYSGESEIVTPTGQRFQENLPWPPEAPLPSAGLCDTCVTPGYCNRTGDCAQGKQMRCDGRADA